MLVMTTTDKREKSLSRIIYAFCTKDNEIEEILSVLEFLRNIEWNRIEYVSNVS